MIVVVTSISTADADLTGLTDSTAEEAAVVDADADAVSAAYSAAAAAEEDVAAVDAAAEIPTGIAALKVLTEQETAKISKLNSRRELIEAAAMTESADAVFSL